MNDQEFLERILDTLDIGVYVISPSGDYIYSNRASQVLLGLTKEQIKNRNVYELANTGHMKTSVSAVVFEQKHDVTALQRVIKDDGSVFRQLVTSQPAFDEDGKVAFAVATQILPDEFRNRFQLAISSQFSEDVLLYDANANRGQSEIVAESKVMQDILALCKRIAKIKSPVLIVGESGTGKEVISNYIHRCSDEDGRRPFIAINCAAVPEQLLESELFGYEKGAFTGAGAAGKPGLIEEANGGTLFLDEINSAPLSFQGKLLRVLETGEVQRLGSVRTKKVNFRLIVATNKDLKALIQTGQFRQDLYYRLSVLPIELPPLRQHKDDIPALCERFLKESGERLNTFKVLSPEILDAFLHYDWPGNIRELRNIVERLAVISPVSEILIDTIPDKGFPEELVTQNGAAPPNVRESIQLAWEALSETHKEDFSLELFLDTCESVLLTDLLGKLKSTYAVADFLKVNQATIARKKKKYGIEY